MVLPQHPQILIVEDETELSASIAAYLEAFGLTTQTTPSAESAREQLTAHTPQLILLDVNLPGQSGFEFCRSIRSSSNPQLSEIPIIFLTARGSEDDEVLALSIGGDDYLRKPFPLGVLLAKVRRTIARANSTPSALEQAASPQEFDDGWLRIDPATARVYVSGTEIPLPAMEYRLLEFLLRERERLVGKQEILDGVWGDAFVGDGTLSVHIRRLRTKIERDADNPRYLRTVWGRGYMFSGAM